MAVLPDEKDVLKPGETPTDEPQIEIIDDSPPEDQGRQPMPAEIAKQVDDDDLSAYDTKAQERLKQLKKVWHDERREKEAAQRERDEAVRFAQNRHQEFENLRKRYSEGETIFYSEMGKASKAQLEQARVALKQAFDSGDSEKIMLAQEALTDAKFNFQKFQRNESPQTSLQAPKESVQQSVTPPAQAPAATPDAKTLAWREKNTWFGSDPEATAAALGLHEKLVRQGISPNTDAYWTQVDASMRRRYPEFFTGEEPPSQAPNPAKKTTTVVAPATRTTSSQSVRLTASQAALAKKLGLDPKTYAAEVIKLRDTNG